ncbi:Rha family transcriptional regulator [Pseudomonas sp. BF-R-01]|uniref:Rha family transcriptional regulator n=1 Tax=Pseudomonas sp. BF-R-01 TaxID=2832365 RepID=UPI001CBAB99E|nr:Rha family transcriptional regulator [Pseudomonas sp. BF-R-01]
MQSQPNSSNTPNHVATRFVNSENVSRTTMSSREIANVTGKRHPDVKRDIQSMAIELGVDVSAFAHIYRDSMNREQTEYLLDREHTDCLLTGYSAPMRMKVIRRWRELEQQQGAREQVLLSGTKVVGELAILECFTRLLKPAPSSQMLMLAKIAANNGLDAKFLPGYAIDAAPDTTGGSSMPTKAVTALIKDFDLRTSAPAFNKLLEAHGFLKEMQRRNSKQEYVGFWSVTDKGLKFGKNLTSPQSPRETQPHWYVDRFFELADLIGKGAK